MITEVITQLFVLRSSDNDTIPYSWFAAGCNIRGWFHPFYAIDSWESAQIAECMLSLFRVHHPLETIISQFMLSLLIRDILGSMLRSTDYGLPNLNQINQNMRKRSVAKSSNFPISQTTKLSVFIPIWWILRKIFFFVFSPQEESAESKQSPIWARQRPGW